MIEVRGSVGHALAGVAILALAACASAPSPRAPGTEPSAPSTVTAHKPTPPASTASSAGSASGAPAPGRGGAYYLDDGPGESPPPNLDRLPDAEPKLEPLHRFANNPYNVFGQDYVPERTLRPFRQRGMASWYGRRFHGGKTAIGEVYDMYQLTAAHPTLPLPSYARVTNTINGRQVIVRVNDRGPFIRGRIIDLSYAAAVKLGYLEQGSTMVEIESITAAEIDALAARGTPAPVGGPERMLEPRGTQQGFPLFTEREGVFVQLGAFAQPDNAEGLRARLLLEMSGAIRSMQIVAKNGLHRLWVGPYRTQQEARSAAEQLASFFR